MKTCSFNGNSISLIFWKRWHFERNNSGFDLFLVTCAVNALFALSRFFLRKMIGTRFGSVGIRFL